MYSGTLPYDHLIYTTTLLLQLLPYSFDPKLTNTKSSYYFEDPINTTTWLLPPGFYGPVVVIFTGYDSTCTLIKNEMPINQFIYYTAANFPISVTVPSLIHVYLKN